MIDNGKATENEERWVINLKWLQQNNRSFTALVRSSLCPKCQKKFKVDQSEAKPNELLKALKTCCSKSVEFIKPGLPLQESIFRVFLANGNQPLTLADLGEQLNQWRGTDNYRTSVPVLTRLLNNDQHYGLQKLPD
jgi:hypothetical protein